MPSLRRLAADRATGVLYSDVGAVYLTDGEVVHAESSAAPGLDELLARGGRLAADCWQQAVRDGGARGGIARRLVDSGRLSRGELEICHLFALFDAAFFVLDASPGAVRFRAGAGHWLGPIRAVPAGAVEREVRRRRRLLDRLWPHPAVDTSPVRRLPEPSTGPGRGRVPRRQRDVLELADGTRTPYAIARQLGRPAFHTLVDVRRLAAAGRVATPPPATPPPRVPPAAPASAGAAVPSPAVPSPAGLSPRRSTEKNPVRLHAVVTDPDVELLRRLRDALEEKL
ncbi:transcriptional regulator [Streptomyces durbertensis]|uniref:Transcriptional regulator n=2 Tax=Streptomyces durbertensis TaxID=2448886 RepID=A0ABR6EL79_9ACTN|nr:transcriptional regulator [Streptomyces durbertensis]